jgi:hypothetical protein
MNNSLYFNTKISSAYVTPYLLSSLRQSVTLFRSRIVSIRIGYKNSMAWVSLKSIFLPIIRLQKPISSDQFWRDILSINKNEIREENPV